MAPESNLRELLAQGKHALSSGRVAEIAELIQAQPRLARRLIEFLFDDDPGVAQRAADVLERISHQPSPPLQRIPAGYVDELLGLMAEAQLKKVRWNLALIVGRLPLTAIEARRVAAILEDWLTDPSSIVKTAALQCLADMTAYDPPLLPKVLDLLRIHGRSGTPARRARSRQLLKKLALTSR
jgi:HEAT repeat protein